MRLPGVGIHVDNWFVRNAGFFTRSVEVLFGLIWLADASLKFQPGFANSFSDLIAGSAAVQPAWLQGWFSFWVSVTLPNPTLFAYFVSLCELALALALILGFMRKTTYAGGMLFSMIIWSVPEGFGGPYGPGSTDIGTGVIYAIVFLLLLGLNAMDRNNDYTLDKIIEKHVKWWSTLAELKR